MIILNINDCPYNLSSNVLDEINKKFNKIDVLLSGYGGAGPYPQCFENFTLEEKEFKYGKPDYKNLTLLVRRSINLEK